MSVSASGDVDAVDDSLEQAEGALIESGEANDLAAGDIAGTADDGVIEDGKVTVANPALSQSEAIQIEADTEECMVDTPMYECYEKFGSYGVRRLYTEEWEDIVKMGYARPTWMEHANVQRRRLFNMTFPGTHNSATYDFTGVHSMLGTGLAFGAQNQHLSIDKQLEAGIRAFDLRLSYAYTEDRLYVSHMVLTVPLADVLGQMRAFLDRRPKEVIMVSAKLGRQSHRIDARYRERILADDTDKNRVPGQIVHHQFLYHFGDMLATYATLRRLPAGESMENPTIASLVAANARVVYFWEGQQVLCTDRQMCKHTPGWTQPWEGLTFGWPLAFGQRRAAGWSTREPPAPPVMEPGCLEDSWGNTRSAHPDRVVRYLRDWLNNLQQKTSDERPLCFPHSGAVPEPGTPTVLYWGDGIVTLSDHENSKQRVLLGQARALFTRGEGFGVMSSAERLNYLLLAWLMKRGAAPLWTRANVIALDFPTPILVHRIIEAMQEQQDCGYAITCKITGSCWAASLLDRDGSCKREEDVLQELELHAASKGIGIFLKVFFGLLAFTFVACSACCTFIVMKRRRAKADEGKKEDSMATPLNNTAASTADHQG